MNDVDIVNRINRPQNVRCRQTSYIWGAATVASDKGSTTIGVRGHSGDVLWLYHDRWFVS